MHLARVCGTALTLLVGAGCYTWRPYQPVVPLADSRGLPYRLRATLTDSSRVALTAPFVRADTLYGRTRPWRDTVAIPVTSVRGLERERLSIWRSVTAYVVAPVAAFVSFFVVGCAIEDCGDSGIP